MADLLGLLRDFTIHNREIKEEGDEIIFHNYAWPKSSKTNYIVWGTDKHGSTKEYYPLESLVYFLKNINLSHAQFVRHSAASNILGIRLPDRQKLLDYLQGRITTCEAIDHSVPVDISQRRLITVVVPPENSENVTEPPSKRLCTEGIRSDEDVDQGDIEMQLKEQQRLAAKLDLPPGGKMTSAEIFQADASLTSSLAEHITVDKIQMLRAKFRANHQQTIKPDESELRDEAKNEPEEVKTFTKIPIGVSKTFVKEIIAREYTWRTRTTILQSHKKTFFDSVVMGTLKSVKMKEENIHQRVGPHTPFPPSAKINGHSGSTADTMQSQVPAHYSRYDQERFTGAGQDTAGFKIDTMGTYHGKGLSSMMTDGPPGAAGSRDPRANRSGIKGSGSMTPGATPIDSGKGYSSGNKPSKSKSKVPIIIIPAGPTSLITMYNAKDILQDLKFEKTEDKKAKGCRRDNELLIQRQKSDGRTVPYRVIDQPNKLNREDWDRVVAVFVQGPAWQFKNWPIGNDPVEIFNVVKAFHLKAAHMPIHPDVKKWNVHVVELDNRRHLDKANFQQIWDILDRHMIKTKPHLRF